MDKRKRITSILAGVMAFVLILGLIAGFLPAKANAYSSKELKQQLNAIMALTEEQGEEKIARMQQMYTTLGIKEAANKAIMGYFNKAVEIIGKIDFTAAQKDQLMLFADKLVKRIK